MCKERNISFPFLGENNVLSKHLDESKFHLKNHGIKVFAENFSRFLVKLNWCQQRKTNLNTSISEVSDNESRDCETLSKQLRKFTKIDYHTK